MLSLLPRSAIRVLPCVLALLAFVAGCGGSGATPVITNVWPATIVPGETQVLLIAGQGFKSGATVTLGGAPGAPHMIALPEVVWVNDRYLTAGLPGGIGGPGSRYSVVVTNPDKQDAVSPQAVAVGGPTPTATPTAVATKPPVPSPTRVRPPATPIEIATPAPTPTQAPTTAVTPSPTAPVPVLIVPPQPVATPAETPSATATAPPAPEIIPALTPTPTPAPPSPRVPPQTGLIPIVPGRPPAPGLPAPAGPGRRAPR